MDNNQDADNCNEIKLQLIKKIASGNCDEIGYNARRVNSYIFFKAHEPIPPPEAQDNKKMFDDNFKGQFKDSFTILKEEINDIIGRNWNKDFMHVFFFNDRNNSNELSLVFRFSKVETFNPSNLDDLTNDSAYWLENKTLKPFTDTDKKFSSLVEDFKNGVGSKISRLPDSKLTEYTTFDMSEILLFRGFENDVTYELMCKKVGYKLRIGLQSLIMDKDRVHHVENGIPIYEGYYDLGNLKP